MPGPSTAELNGLNPQVQVEPLTLAIVSLPPLLVEEALVEELFEPPPHPATTSDTIDIKATNVSHVKRFIGPPFPKSPSEGFNQGTTPFVKCLNKRNISSAASQINSRDHAPLPVGLAGPTTFLRDL